MRLIMNGMEGLPGCRPWLVMKNKPRDLSQSEFFE